MPSPDKTSTPLPFDTEAFWDMPLVVILRGIDPAILKPLTLALTQGGLKTIEVTMNTPGAADQIRSLIQWHASDGVQIGAGTVTDPSRLEEAVASGASFIVTPQWDDQVVRMCQQMALPFIPGCLTPTEIVRAHEAGALAAKLFPAEALGPGYVRAIKAPLPQIKLAPTGGVTVERLKAYMEAGADAFGIGSPLFPAKILAARQWGEVERMAEHYCQTFKSEQLKRDSISD